MTTLEAQEVAESVVGQECGSLSVKIRPRASLDDAQAAKRLKTGSGSASPTGGSRPTGKGSKGRGACRNVRNPLHKRRGRKGKSIYRGVCVTREGKWRAVIYKDRKQLYLGVFDSEVVAAKAHDRAARHHFGDCAVINFPEPHERGSLSLSPVPDAKKVAVKTDAMVLPPLLSRGSSISNSFDRALPLSPSAQQELEDDEDDEEDEEGDAAEAEAAAAQLEAHQQALEEALQEEAALPPLRKVVPFPCYTAAASGAGAGFLGGLGPICQDDPAAEAGGTLFTSGGMGMLGFSCDPYDLGTESLSSCGSSILADAGYYYDSSAGTLYASPAFSGVGGFGNSGYGGLDCMGELCLA